ncbi:MAG: hypothetical protein IKB86_01335 [Clostridia bacterium]|nr:hypothetical protein [Clostridia bacterium]
MKKIITLILAVALVFSMATASFSVNAEAELKNFFDMEAITPVGIGGGEAAKKEVDGETVYSNTKIDYRWCSMGFDILPALKDALGDDDFVEVTLVFQIKTDWTDEFAGHKTSCKPLLRAFGVSNVSDSDAWNSAYEDALDGAEAVFNTTDGKNVLCTVSTKRIPLNDEGWTTYTVDLYYEKAQLECAMTPQWIFCIDEMNGAHQPSGKEAPKGKLVMFDEVLFKDVAIYYTEDYLASVGTPTPEPTPVPTATPEPEDDPIVDEGTNDGTNDGTVAEPTATPTARPTATPTDEADNKDDEQKDEEAADLTWLWIAIAAVVVVGAVVAVVVVLNKKKAAGAEDAADETPEE